MDIITFVRDKSTTIIRVAGPLLAAVVSGYGGFSPAYWLLGIAAWMILWWITETVHLGATALLPLLLFPMLGLGTGKELAGYYAHPLVYLFFGGFVLALALEKTNLHYRIALWILRRTGTGAKGLLAGFMLATAFMSMWISNTATSIMMLPIATSVLGILPEKSREALNKPILLSVAWAANIGGMATIIGTPPNMIFAGFMSEQLGRPIGFVEWLPVGLSAALLLGLTAFLILGRRLDQGTLTLEEREETEHWLAKEWDRLGSLDPAQKRVAFIFAGTSLLWIVRPYLAQWTPSIEWSDTAIALLAAMSLFSIQNGKGAPLVHWSDTRDLPWGILVLFGGGLALAGTLQESYWFDALGQSLTALSQLPVWMWLLVMAVLGVFATEMLSNMALVSALLPLTLSLSIALGIPMYELSLPLVLGASCAFMLPMATPPNAIVFSTGKLTMPYMMGRGLVLNVVSVVVLAALGWVIYGMG